MFGAIGGPCFLSADNDCDDELDEDYDLDGDGWKSCWGDCDDLDPAVFPGAEETCDGVDEDCDDAIDEVGPCGDDDDSSVDDSSVDDDDASPDDDDASPDDDDASPDDDDSEANDDDSSVDDDDSEANDDDSGADDDDSSDPMVWSPGCVAGCHAPGMPGPGLGLALLLLGLASRRRREGDQDRPPRSACAPLGLLVLALPSLLAVPCAVAQEPDAGAAGRARDLAVRAIDLNEGPCAAIGVGDATASARALAEVAPLLVDLSAEVDAGGPDYLLYWRGAMQQCIGRVEPATDDLKILMERTDGRGDLSSLRADAVRRLRRLRYGARRTADAVDNEGPGPPSVALAFGGGYQFAHDGLDHHYFVAPVDLTVRIVGPFAFFAHARPSASAPNRTQSGQLPADQTVSWLVPFGAGVALRGSGRVRPVAFVAAQFGLSQRPEEDLVVLPGALVGGGIEFQLGAAPVALRPSADVGFLGAVFNLRVGIQITLQIGAP